MNTQPGSTNKHKHLYFLSLEKKKKTINFLWEGGLLCHKFMAGVVSCKGLGIWASWASIHKQSSAPSCEGVFTLFTEKDWTMLAFPMNMRRCNHSNGTRRKVAPKACTLIHWWEVAGNHSICRKHTERQLYAYETQIKATIFSLIFLFFFWTKFLHGLGNKRPTTNLSIFLVSIM